MNVLRALAPRLVGSLALVVIPACCETTSPGAPPPPGGPGALVGDWSGTATYGFPLPQTFDMDIQFDGTNLVVEMNGTAYSSYVTHAEDPDFRFKTAFPLSDTTVFVGTRQPAFERIQGTLTVQGGGTSGTWTVQRVGPAPEASTVVPLRSRGSARAATR